MIYDLRVCPEQLKQLAQWVQTGPGMAQVELLADDRMLLAEQGDDRAAWDTDGSTASDEYLERAPLDQRQPRQPMRVPPTEWTVLAHEIRRLATDAGRWQGEWERDVAKVALVLAEKILGADECEREHQLDEQGASDGR